MFRTGSGELAQLGRTLHRRRADVLAYFEYRASNGPTEAINGRLEALRRHALGFRNYCTTGFGHCCTVATSPTRSIHSRTGRAPLLLLLLSQPCSSSRCGIPFNLSRSPLRWSRWLAPGSASSVAWSPSSAAQALKTTGTRRRAVMIERELPPSNGWPASRVGEGAWRLKAE